MITGGNLGFFSWDFGLGMIFIGSPILTYFYGNAGIVLGFVVVVL